MGFRSSSWHGTNDTDTARWGGNTRRIRFPSIFNDTTLTQRRAASYQSTTSKKNNDWFKMKDKEKMERCLYVQTVIPKGDMDYDNFKFCLSAVAGLCKKPDILEQDVGIAESLLERLYEETRCENPNIPPLTARPYVQVIRAWARTESPHALDKCLAIWERMQHRYEEDPSMEQVYSALLYACGQTTHPEARWIADDLIRAFEANARNNKTMEHLPVELYNAVILVHASRAAKEYGAAAAAEDWLIYLSKLYTEGGPAPNTDSFNRVLRAWSQIPETNAVQRSKEILDLMLQLKDDHHNIEPDPTTFATVLLACTNHGLPEQATEFWHETLNYFRQKSQKVDLSDCLRPVSMAWSKSGRQEAADRVREVLEGCFQMQQDTDLSNIEFSIEALESTFKNVLHCHIQNGNIQKAEKELREFWHSQDSAKCRIASPECLHYICQAYNQSDVADKAPRVIRLLLDAVGLSRTQNMIQVPETRTYNLAIDMCLQNPETKTSALAILNEVELAGRANLYTYALIINSLCKEKTKESALKAFDFAKKLHLMHMQDLIQMKRTHFGLYTKVAFVLASLPDRETSYKCFELFDMIKSSRRWKIPTSMYNSVIFSLRGQGEIGRRKAFQLFQEIRTIESKRSEIVSLDVFLCVTVIKVLRSEGDVQAAADSLTVLSEMLQLYDQGRKNLCPNQACLDACLINILACGDARILEAGHRLVRTLRTLFDEGQLKELPSENLLKSLDARK
jgi:hypothetical protein